VYIEYINELDTLIPSSVRTCYSFLTLKVVVTLILFGTYVFQVTWMS
jgi:hypothetical protein